MIFLIALSIAAAQPAPGETPADAPAPVFTTAAALDQAALDTTTAREDLAQIAIANQTAQVANSSVSGTSTTGAVAISGNAFQGSSGLTIVNANSGNNVAINAALNVNIIFAPAK